MRAALLIAGACAAALGAYAVWGQDDAPPARLQTTSAAAAASAAASPASGASFTSLLSFGGGAKPLAAASAASASYSTVAAGLTSATGTAPAASASSYAPPPPLSPADLAANEALRQLGYFIEERYYKMGLEALRQAAAAQDVQALTHLAERYMFELDGRPQAAGHEPGFAYLQAAREALQSAYLLGNLHAAAMLSESYLMERQVVDAAAWNLVAQRSGDKLSADWFLTTEDYRRLSAAQRRQASQAADRLWAALQARKTGGA